MIIMCYSDPESVVPIEVDLCDFVKKSPDSYSQNHIEGDNRYYLPHDMLLSAKKQI